MKRKIFQWLFLLLTAAGIALRITELGRSLEYDEIWTLEHYVFAPVRVIFTDLSVPNNHPVHSLAIKAAFAVFEPNILTLRLPALLGGIAALCFCYFLTLRLFHSRRIALFTLLLMVCNAWSAAYAQVARGYSIQLALLLFCAWGLLDGARKKCGICRTLRYAGSAAAAFLSVLTLPTSVLYLAPVYALMAWNDRRNRALWISGGIAGILSLAYLGINYEQFRQGQVFGTVINSAGAFLQFVFSTLTELVPWPLLLFALVPFFSAGLQRKACALALLIAFPLAAALLTRAGGVRVYQPVIPPLLMLASLGVWNLYHLASRRRNGLYIRLAMPAAALAAALWGFRIQSEAIAPPDWQEIFQHICKLPPEIIVAYPGNGSVPAEWNNRQAGITADLAMRLACSAPERYLLQLAETSTLNGLNQSGGEQELAVPVPGKQLQIGRLPAVLYRLEPLREKPTPSDIVIAVMPPQTPERLREQGGKLYRSRPDWLHLNQPLCREILTEKGVRRIRLFAVRAGDLPDYWDAVLAMANPELQFYRLR